MHHPLSLPALHPGVHHLHSEVAVAATEVEVLLTTLHSACRLTPDHARAVGWALIEAAEHVAPSA